MKVVKVNNARREFDADSLILGYQHNSTNDRELFPLGKHVISLPYKKGRRILIKGIIDAEPESVKDSGLWWNYTFKPLNEVQLRKMQRMFPVAY